MKIKVSGKNRKLGNIPNISLPPTRTCIGMPCISKCYAMKFYRMYPSVKAAWDYNWKCLQSDQSRYFEQLAEYLRKKHTKYFRWHVGGDIPSKDYAIGMIDIANQFPGTRFLAFTKKPQYFKDLRVPPNFQVVYSVWPCQPIPGTARRFPKAFCQDGSEKRVKNALECPGNCINCGMCWQLGKLNKNVVFNIH